MTTTNVTNGVTLSDAGWANDVDTATYSGLTVVAGTNTITATGPASLTVHGAGKGFTFVPANTNTGATTINPTCNSVALGAKNIFWNGVACVGGELRANIPVRILYDGTQYHITGNGFNAPFNDAHPIVSGSADQTKKIRIEADGLTTATTRVWTAPDSDVTILTGAATQAEQETATSLTVAVTPGRQHFNPSASKGWAQFNGLTAGTNAPTAGYNVTSITRTGTGAYTVNWTNSFSSGNYAVTFSSNVTNGAGNPLFQITAIAAGTVSFTVLRRGDGAADDASLISVIAFGDL